MKRMNNLKKTYFTSYEVITEYPKLQIMIIITTLYTDKADIKEDCITQHFRKIELHS